MSIVLSINYYLHRKSIWLIKVNTAHIFNDCFYQNVVGVNFQQYHFFMGVKSDFTPAIQIKSVWTFKIWVFWLFFFNVRRESCDLVVRERALACETGRSGSDSRSRLKAFNIGSDCFFTKRESHGSFGCQFD